jgi:hypothetical protein
MISFSFLDLPQKFLNKKNPIVKKFCFFIFFIRVEVMVPSLDGEDGVPIRFGWKSYRLVFVG